ncbi:hypothetical protein MD484_g6493, partial [Candolleomyces efflorescens]
MLPKFLVLLAFSTSVALGAPVRREVPQEHSHEKFLRSVQALLVLNNPDGIVDAVFGLLGNAAAANGAGRIADANCLQQATADQAFTNAKAAGNVQGQVDALIYRALERNSLSVGATTTPCTTIQAVNPEIAAIQQHQDPASPNAAAVNKAIALELARQIKSVGGNPLDALQAGTFSPGNLNDATARGNSCNEPNDAQGCIFTQNLLIPDASEAEILAAVGDTAAATTTAAAETATTTAADTGATGTCAPPRTVTVTVAPTATANAGASTASPTAAASVGGNLQRFTGSLAGQVAPTVTVGGRGFQVEGSDSFLNIGAALGRSCDIQHNKCANVANSAAGRSQGLSVGQCDQQNNACRAANA